MSAVICQDCGGDVVVEVGFTVGLGSPVKLYLECQECELSGDLADPRLPEVLPDE